jgi:hypothetical protein
MTQATSFECGGRRVVSGRAAVAAAAIACASIVLVAASARAEGDIRERFHAGAMHAGLTVGYGYGFRFGSDANKRLSAELGEVRPVAVIPRFGYGFTDPIGGDSFLRGNVDLIFEAALLYDTEPHEGFGGGVGTSLRYNFLCSRLAVPYAEINLGVLGLDFDLNRQSDGFNFNVGAGVGSHWRLNDELSITTEIRWQHISNAYTQRPNDGINTIQFLIGFYRWY